MLVYDVRNLDGFSRSGADVPHEELMKRGSRGYYYSGATVADNGSNQDEAMIPTIVSRLLIHFDRLIDFPFA